MWMGGVERDSGVDCALSGGLAEQEDPFFRPQSLLYTTLHVFLEPEEMET